MTVLSSDCLKNRDHELEAIRAELVDGGGQRCRIRGVGEIKHIERGEHLVEIAVGGDASLIEIGADGACIRRNARPIDEHRSAIVRRRENIVRLRNLKFADDLFADIVLQAASVAPEKSGGRVCDGPGRTAPELGAGEIQRIL